MVVIHLRKPFEEESSVETVSWVGRSKSFDRGNSPWKKCAISLQSCRREDSSSKKKGKQVRKELADALRERVLFYTSEKKKRRRIHVGGEIVATYCGTTREKVFSPRST